MKCFALDESSRDNLARINAECAGKGRQLAPVPLTDGRWVILADAVGDDYWSQWHELLKGLGEPIEIGPESFIRPTSLEDAVTLNDLKNAYQSEMTRLEIAVNKID